MKKILIFLTLNFFLISNSNADWTFLQDIESEHPGKFYTDIKTLKKDGDYIYIWTMQDLDKGMVGMDETGAMAVYSVKEFNKIDCKLNRIEKLQYVFYSGNMGTGKVKNYQKDKQEWLYYPPGTMMGEFINSICKNFN